METERNERNVYQLKKIVFYLLGLSFALMFLCNLTVLNQGSLQNGKVTIESVNSDLSPLGTTKSSVKVQPLYPLPLVRFIYENPLTAITVIYAFVYSIVVKKTNTIIPVGINAPPLFN